MITERDLLEAIAECQGERNPNANTCIKLAAYYTILDNIRTPEVSGASFAPSPGVIEYDGETEFARTVYGQTTEKVMPVMDELMTAVSVLNPRLYNHAIDKLREALSP